MSSAAPLLSVSGLSKSYPSFTLSDISLDLQPGEVHALVGENGAGKSTLSRILAGLTAPDAGRMTLGGRPYAPANRRAAEHCGVRMVLQELNLIATLTIAENIFLDQMPHRFGWIDRRRLAQEARASLAQVGLGDLDPWQPVRTLGVGQQQLVEIAAGLSRRCDVLILDEPTAALTDPEIERLFAQVARLKARGVGLIYISHRLEEIRRVADRVTVLRDGRLAATRPAAEVSLEEIVRLMVGRELAQAVHRQPGPPGPVALRVRGLCRGQAVREVSFEARRGEILGFAGLMGSGRTETMRLIFGADCPDRGEIFLHGSDTPARLGSPREAVKAGLALLTEDRKQQGLFLPLSIGTNITLSCLRAFSRLGGWLRTATERAAASRWCQALQIRGAALDRRVAELSGGNQQKVVLARWLCRDCDILIFDEPTRGIDVGAKFEIYQLLDRLAAQGKTILLVSSDLKELLGVCDRIAVMSAGRLTATFVRGDWTRDLILSAALSEHVKPAARSGEGRTA